MTQKKHDLVGSVVCWVADFKIKGYKAFGLVWLAVLGSLVVG